MSCSASHCRMPVKHRSLAFAPHSGAPAPRGLLHSHPRLPGCRQNKGLQLHVIGGSAPSRQARTLPNAKSQWNLETCKKFCPFASQTLPNLPVLFLGRVFLGGLTELTMQKICRWWHVIGIPPAANPLCVISHVVCRVVAQIGPLPTSVICFTFSPVTSEARREGSSPRLVVDPLQLRQSSMLV